MYLSLNVIKEVLVYLWWVQNKTNKRPKWSIGQVRTDENILLDWVFVDRKFSRQTSKDRPQIAEKLFQGPSKDRLSVDRPVHLIDPFIGQTGEK